MLREKRVARAARTFIVFVDESKRVRRLGTRAPVPVEVAAHRLAELLPWLEGLGARCVARQGGAFRTDNGNAVVDCHFEGGIPDKLVRSVKNLCEQGTHDLDLAALDDDAALSYDRDLAQRLVNVGAHVGAMTPGQLAEWIASKVHA